MKKIFLMLVVMGFIMQSYSQENLSDKEIPVAVMSSFKNSYPSVKDAKWTKEGIYYQGSFTKNDMDKRVTYDASGKLIKSHSEIESSALPPTAADYVKQHYNKEEVKKAFRVTDSRNTVTYEAEVKGDELNFDSEGNIINAKEE
jgi:hypothetical protein